MKQRLSKVLLYLTGSILFLSLPFLSSPDFPSITKVMSNPVGRREVVIYCTLLAFFYLSYYILIPKLFFTKKFLGFYTVITLIFTCVIFALTATNPDKSAPRHILPAHHQSQETKPPLRQQPPQKSNKLRVLLTDFNFYLFLVIFAFAMLLALNKRWSKLKEEKLATELSYLKSQINPHFLFNTLNSIYALALDKSEQTATAIVKLSGMMRYVLQESQNDFVPLEKEVEYINEYIALQQLRLEKNTQVQYIKDIITPKSNLVIAPLILITFIENAYKYGISTDTPSIITIELLLKDTTLSLKTSNAKMATLQEEASYGIGITNAQNRLNLLYPNHHTLHIHENDRIFKVELNIELS